MSCVIIGAGQAGANLAFSLRDKGYSQPIILLGEEAEPPYERPPLSKSVLRGERALEQIQVRPLADYDSHNITLRSSACVVQVDSDSAQVVLASGEVIDYQQLVFATGGKARKLAIPGAELPGVHTLRTLQDAQRLSAQLTEGKKLVIVGAGFIGLEVAASARRMGVEVTVLEAAPRVLQRSLPADIAEQVVSLHQQHGVQFRYGAQLECFTGEECVTGVQLKGELLAADLVLVGIGLVPSVELAEAAGLEVNNGIVTDACGASSKANIYAIGDCANSFHPLYQRQLRLESWQSANLQAQACATAIVGSGEPNTAVPWLWSDQYDWSFQVCGLISPDCQLIQRGCAEAGKAIYFALEQGKLVAVVGWGLGTSIAKDVRVAQMLLQQQLSPAAEQLADESISLKKLLKAG